MSTAVDLLILIAFGVVQIVRWFRYEDETAGMRYVVGWLCLTAAFLMVKVALLEVAIR